MHFIRIKTRVNAAFASSRILRTAFLFVVAVVCTAAFTSNHLLSSESGDVLSRITELRQYLVGVLTELGLVSAR